MGLMNSMLGNIYEICPVTGEKTTYNFISSIPRVDGYEYKIESLNPYTIICITGSALDDDYLLKLSEYKEVISNMISSCTESHFFVDTYLYGKII